MEVKRTYGKPRTVALEVPAGDNTFDKLLFGEENDAPAKVTAKPRIRASFNRDSSLDESKVQKLKAKQKKIYKSKRHRHQEPRDEMFDSFMREIKQDRREENLKKKALRNKKLDSVHSVKASTPVQTKLRKQTVDLAFEISPISAATGELSKSLIRKVQQKRIEDMDQLRKKLETTAIREAKNFLAQFETKTVLTNSENIPVENQEIESNKRKPNSAESKAKENRAVHEVPRRNRKTTIKRQSSESVNQTDEISINIRKSTPEVPVVVVSSPEASILNNSGDNSLGSPLQFFDVIDNQTASIEKLPSEPPKKKVKIVKPSRFSFRGAKSSNVCDTKKSVPVMVPVMSSPVIQEIAEQIAKKPRVMTRSSAAPSTAGTKADVVLHPGKWRRSLIAWRHSQEFVAIRRQSQKVSLKSQENNKAKRYTQRLLQTLEESVLLEQSDEENLQAALSILDSSIKCAKTFHEQRKTSQRKTSVFQRSSIFYGLQDPVIDVAPSISARQIALRRCGQQEPLPFDEVYSENKLPNCCKIGEGVYGEVFMYKCPSTNKPIVLKIIPIEGDQLINGESQKRFEEILQEIVISMELSGLRHGLDYSTDGFVNVKRVTCIRGAYPEHLIDEWELYRDNRAEGSDNDHPEIFQPDQLYVVFELCNGGKDLESFVFNNAEEAQSVFLQTALTLAVAEGKYEFEHRDLHWGNLLIAPTEEKFSEYRIAGKTFKVLNHGVKVTIIDYSLSRMVYDGAVLYDNLARDDELFESQGDYQFDIYRLMRARVENNFERYEPFTNLLWLHYVVDKLINGARYRHSKTKKHRAAIHDLMEERDDLLNFTSASDYVSTLDF